jgi:dihydropteroate synthase
MEDEGADILDVGGESTRPETWTGPGLPEEEELARVLPVIRGMRRAVTIPISVDTYKSGVALAAIAAGAAMVNDVWALRSDPRLAEVVAETGVPVVLMHNSRSTAYKDVIGDILRWLEESMGLASAAGISAERLILDPGIGFGKTPAQNLEIIRRLSELRRLGRPLLVGPSRKSFIGRTLELPVDQRLEGTAAAVAIAIASGADMVRVHDVKAMVRVARLADAIVREA